MEERECACDEEVLELGSQREVYAESILKICEFCVGSPLACVSGVTGADLKRRIVRIMTTAPRADWISERKFLLGAAARRGGGCAGHVWSGYMRRRGAGKIRLWRRGSNLMWRR